MIVWMLRAVYLSYINFCATLCTVGIALCICIFYFQGCPLKDVIRKLLIDLETYLQVQRYKITCDNTIEEIPL